MSNPKKMAEGGIVGQDYLDAGLSSLGRFARTLPEAARDWPRQVRDLVRLPADLILGGSPEEKQLQADTDRARYEAILRGDTRPSLTPLPEAQGGQRYRANTPERAAHDVAEFANPLVNTMFAPKQTARFLNSPVGQKTMGGLAALMTGVGDIASPQLGGALGVIKRRGGVWDPQYGPAQLTDQLLETDTLGESNPQILARLREETRRADLGIYNEAVGNFIRGPLETYFKRDFASPTDRIRMLADEGITHLNLGNDFVPEPASSVPGWQRMAKTRAGKDWEDTADSYVSSTPARNHVMNDFSSFTQNGFDAYGNPVKVSEYSGEILPSFLNNVSPDEPVHMINQISWAPQELGITHMIDTLMNSLEAGRLTPEQVMSPRFTIDAAVRHVHQANEQAIKDAGKAARARMEKLTPIKEYPEGYKWYELPDTSDPEAMKLANSIGCEGGWCTQEEWAAKNYGSGGNRLRVLIGPDGKAVTQMTVEGTREGNTPQLVDLIGYNTKFAEDLQTSLANSAKDHPEWLNGMPNDQQTIEFALKNFPELQEVKDFQSFYTGSTKANVTEIKGRFNDSPKPEYRRFIQDLIKDDDYGKISDYRNAGLINMGEFSGNSIPGYMNSEDAIAAVKVLQEQNPNIDYSSWIPVLKSWGE